MSERGMVDNDDRKRHLRLYNHSFVKRVHADRRREESERREQECKRRDRMREAAQKPKRRRRPKTLLPPMPLAECLRISTQFEDQDKIREAVEEICRRFDVTAKEIQGLERRKAISQARDAIVLKLDDMGVPKKNIAALLRRDRSTVSYRLGKLGRTKR